MASSSFRPSTRRVVIDLTDDDGVEKHDIQSYINQIASLKAQVTGLKTNVLDLQADLEHSQVDLKYTREKLQNAIVANRHSDLSDPTNSRISTSKRPRSPSLDSVDPQAWKKRKAKVREEREQIVVKPPISPRKPKLEVYVDVPNIETMASRFKIEKESPKKTTIPDYDSLSGSDLLSQSGNRPETKEPRRDIVALRPDSQLDSDVSCSSPSGTTIPDIQGHRDQMVASTSSAQPTKPPVARVVTTKKVHNGLSRFAKMDLQSTAGLVISPSPVIIPVPRALLQSRYGGSTRTLIQNINKQHNPSSGFVNRQLIYPDFEHNPDLPLKPGAPGFIYASRKDVEGQSFSLFVRCLKSEKRVWKYFGEYETERCGAMTTQHFRSLPHVVQSAWAKSIQGAKSEPTKEYIAMRVRIKLRQTRVMPTGDLVEGLVQEELKKKQTKKAKTDVTGKKKSPEELKEQSDILEAMLHGQEHLGMVKLTCISYDHVFAEDIRQTFKRAMAAGTIENFIHPQSALILTNLKSRNNNNSKASTSRWGKRRKKTQVEESTEDDDQSCTGALDDANVSREQSVSDRQLRPKKSARYVMSDADYEAEEGDESE